MEFWLYDEIPLTIKEKFGLGPVEHGMDLLLKSNSGEYTSVQCKFSNDQSTKLGWTKHKTSHLFSYFIRADRFILFSNCETVDDVTSSRSENFTFFNIANLLEIDQSTFINISLLVDNKLPNKKTFHKPHEHQQKAINECYQRFTEGEESRGQLI